MSFLDVIPHTLFRMLSSSAHARNVAVLEAIFEQFFDDFAFAPKKAEVLQVIRQVLDNPDFRTIADDGELPTPETAEHIVYGRLRDDGWIMEVANRKATEVYMPREAHALLSSLITLKEELKVDISAEASLIDSGILAAYQDPAGKVMNIASARRQAVQLRRSIDGVLTSLHRIEEDLMRSEGLADLLTKFMERFVEKLLLENYRSLKASAYNPMRFQRSILTNTERFINDEGQIARAALALADQRLVPDIATAQVIEMTALARELGMDGVMITPPYYVLPTPADIVAHYQAVSDAVDIPILLYNIPHVTGVDLTPELVLRLAEIDHVGAIKESSHDFMPLVAMIKTVGDRLRVFAGYSALRGLPAVSMGVDGFISVADTQVMGREGVDLFMFAREGKIAQARAIQYRCIRLIDALNRVNGTFPAPLKAAMNLVGRPGGYPRDPIQPLTAGQQQMLRGTLQELGLVEPPVAAGEARGG